MHVCGSRATGAPDAVAKRPLGALTDGTNAAPPDTGRRQSTKTSNNHPPERLLHREKIAGKARKQLEGNRLMAARGTEDVSSRGGLSGNTLKSSLTFPCCLEAVVSFTLLSMVSLTVLF